MIVAGILYDTETHTGYIIHTATPAWHALLDWLEFHHLDPMQLVRGSTVVRDAPGCRLTAEWFCTDSDGRVIFEDGDARTERRTEQGEAPPLPIPAVVLHECARIDYSRDIDDPAFVVYPTASSPRPMLQP